MSSDCTPWQNEGKSEPIGLFVFDADLSVLFPNSLSYYYIISSYMMMFGGVEINAPRWPFIHKELRKKPHTTLLHFCIIFFLSLCVVQQSSWQEDVCGSIAFQCVFLWTCTVYDDDGGEAFCDLAVVVS